MTQTAGRQVSNLSGIARGVRIGMVIVLAGMYMPFMSFTASADSVQQAAPQIDIFDLELDSDQPGRKPGYKAGTDDILSDLENTPTHKAWHERGLAYLAQNDLALAVIAFRKAQKLARKAGDTVTEAAAFRNLGIILTRQWNFAPAETAFADAMELYRAQGNKGSQYETLYNLAILYKQSGRPLKAQRTYRRLLQALGSDRKLLNLRVRTLNNLGNLLRDEGRFSQAEAVLRKAVALGEKSGQTRLAKRARLNLALVTTAMQARRVPTMAYSRRQMERRNASGWDYRRSF